MRLRMGLDALDRFFSSQSPVPVNVGLTMSCPRGKSHVEETGDEDGFGTQPLLQCVRFTQFSIFEVFVGSTACFSNASVLVI